MALNNFTTGELADFSFGFEGLSFDSSLTTPPVTPAYDTAQPPAVLSACVYQDGVLIPVNEVGVSVENTLAFKTSTCSANGKIGSRISERVVTGTINPYKQDDDIANFTKFKNNTEFSIFGFMAIPTGTTGEVKDVVAFYMPNCTITEYAETDSDGMLQESISFNATRGTDGSEEEIYICSI